MENVTDLGIVVASVVFILKTVFDFVAKMGKNGQRVDMGKMAGQVGEMHRWHAPGSDGRQVWKNPGIETAMDRLIGVVEELTRAVQTQVTTVDDIHRIVQECPKTSK